MSFRYQHGDRPLPGYTIHRGVGRGGFGEVYYALSDGGREVALKAIFFNQEIELRGVRQCINLKSPQLVSIFDVRPGEDGTPFVIMEYVTGPSLRDLLRSHPQGLGAQKTGFLTREIAKGLVYLHERGIVHRDLKPENIFYEDGFVKIGDYGLSKFINASHQSGQTISVGTVHYMAPEIGSGNYHKGIDIYALGVILYELLTGDVPFKGDSFGEILMRHLTTEPDLAKLDEPFRDVVARAMAKKPEERYQSAEELASDLFRSDDLSSSVAAFNPATLSQAARRAGEELGAARPASRAPNAVVGPADGARSPATAQPAANAAAGGVAADPAAATVKTPPPAPASDGATPYAATPNTPTPPPSPRPAEGVRRPRLVAETAARLDPMTSADRMGRFSFFVACVGIFAALFMGIGYAVGISLAAAGAAFAVFLAQTTLAKRFQVTSWFGRNLMAGAVGALPAILGAEMAVRARYDEESMMAVLIGMFFVHWHDRVDPLRFSRVQVGSAMTAAFWGIIVAAICGADGFFVAGVLGLTSLLVNDLAPFAPHERRRHFARGDASASPSPTTATSPAAASPTVKSPTVPTGGTGESGWSWEEVSDKVTAAVDHARQRTQQAFGRSASGSASAPEVPGPRPLAEYPPSTLTRVFWVLAGATMAAAAVPLIVAHFFVRLRPDEALACSAFGMACVGFSGFSFYRGIWARLPTFWGRTLHPFLLVTTATSATICAALFVLAPSLGLIAPHHREEHILILCALLGSVFLFGLVLVVNHLFPRQTRALDWRDVPRHLRPVPLVFRAANLFLGASALVGAVASFSVGLMSSHSHREEKLAFLGLSVGLLFGAVFFVRQGLRRRRGFIWNGRLRPFLITLAGAAVTVCALPLLLDIRLHGEEQMVLLTIASIATSFGVAVFFLRPPGQVAESPLTAPLNELGLPGSEKPLSSWSSCGLVSWMLALAAGISAVAYRLGLLTAGPLASHVGDELLLFARGPALLCTVLFAAAGVFCILIGRRHLGGAHLVRAVIGQLCLAFGLWAFFDIAFQASVDAGGAPLVGRATEEVFSFLVASVFSVACGIVLLIWPARAAHEAREEAQPESPRRRRPGSAPASVTSFFFAGSVALVLLLLALSLLA